MQIKKLLSVAVFATTVSLLTTSCAYRADLNQGNYVEQDLVNQLAYGMSAEQVRFVLGTPMLIDPYDKSRWYYVCFKREGWSSPTVQKLVLLFNGDTLVDMSGDYKKPTTFGEGLKSAPNGGKAADFDFPE